MKHDLRALAAVAGLALCGSVSAAGMATHALMADVGREALPDGVMKTILTQHRPSLLAGAIHPDGGYGSGAVFPEDREMAERAHWEDFNDAFIAHLRDIGCAGELRNVPLPRQPYGLLDLNALSDRCGKLIAFAFGNAAHGLTDETWDSLFEPVVRERDLAEPAASLVQPREHAHGPSCRNLFGTPGDSARLRSALQRGDQAAVQRALSFGPVPGIEYAMDMVAIVERNLLLDATLVAPPAADLAAVHARNRPELGITAAQVRRGFLVSRAAVLGERLIAPIEAPRMRQVMPWAASNYHMASGGVTDSGRMVARLYEHLWAKLTADAPLPVRVIGVHPENGEHDVPVAADAAEARIRAFTGQSAPEAAVEQPGVICLFDEAGNRVPGETRSGIYDPEWGHVIDFRPDADLLPDHRYTVVVTDRLVDHFGLTPESAHSWSFRTAATPGS